MDKGWLLAKRKNMVPMGAIVTAGSGKAIVTAIGTSTELGRISKLLADKDDKKTPLQVLSLFAYSNLVD